MARRLLQLLALWTTMVGIVQCCPELCSCLDKFAHQFADCAYKDLLAVPVGLPSNVTTLSLSANKIKLLKSKSFINVTQIFNNPFSCSCNLEWLRDWIATTKISVPEQNTIVCDAPEHLRGTLVTNMPRLNCGKFSLLGNLLDMLHILSVVTYDLQQVKLNRAQQKTGNTKLLTPIYTHADITECFLISFQKYYLFGCVTPS
uniref:LRRCT domain-containing protein n=1 Tax=Sphaeramia orbicularis TaxID=375764 RepID=A0A673CVQ0_9TELE